jgi:hypothetical protein
MVGTPFVVQLEEEQQKVEEQVSKRISSFKN